MLLASFCSSLWLCSVWGRNTPQSRQCSVQSHTPTNLNAHLAVGLSREKEMLEHDAAIQLHLAWSTNLKKETNTSSSAHPSVGNTRVVVFITHTYNCGHNWLCDYRGNSSALWGQLSTVLHSVRLKLQPVRIAGRRSRTGSELQHSVPYPVEIWPTH